jgi:hypothetical protein
MLDKKKTREYSRVFKYCAITPDYFNSVIFMVLEKLPAFTV